MSLPGPLDKGLRTGIFHSNIIAIHGKRPQLKPLPIKPIHGWQRVTINQARFTLTKDRPCYGPHDLARLGHPADEETCARLYFLPASWLASLRSPDVICFLPTASLEAATQIQPRAGQNAVGQISTPFRKMMPERGSGRIQPFSDSRSSGNLLKGHKFRLQPPTCLGSIEKRLRWLLLHAAEIESHPPCWAA
jgi:hypothetical protein